MYSLIFISYKKTRIKMTTILLQYISNFSNMGILILYMLQQKFTAKDFIVF